MAIAAADQGAKLLATFRLQGLPVVHVRHEFPTDEAPFFLPGSDGAKTHLCIDAVTRAAADFGYECAVAHDACATLDVEFNGVEVPAAQVHAPFMAGLGFAYANVASAEELIAGL